jgi:hypothetical protein
MRVFVDCGFCAARKLGVLLQPQPVSAVQRRLCNDSCGGGASLVVVVDPLTRSTEERPRNGACPRYPGGPRLLAVGINGRVPQSPLAGS